MPQRSLRVIVFEWILAYDKKPQKRVNDRNCVAAKTADWQGKRASVHVHVRVRTPPLSPPSRLWLQRETLLRNRRDFNHLAADLRQI